MRPFTVFTTMPLVYNPGYFKSPIFPKPLLVYGRNKMPAGVFVQKSDKTAVCNRHARANQGRVFLQGRDHKKKKISPLAGQ